MVFSPTGQEKALAAARNFSLVHHFADRTIMYMVYDNNDFVTPSSHTCIPSRGPGCCASDRPPSGTLTNA
jgi:hypothetical protein